MGKSVKIVWINPTFASLVTHRKQRNIHSLISKLIAVQIIVEASMPKVIQLSHILKIVLLVTEKNAAIVWQKTM